MPSMRPGPLLHFLLYTTAPIALAAPVLPLDILVKESLDNDAISIRDQPPPTTVTLEGARTVLLNADHSRIALEEETVQVVIDNRPLTLPPTQLPASGVLSSARPLTTEYLQALSRLQLEQAQAEAQAEAQAQAQAQAQAVAVAEAQQQVVDTPEPLVRRIMPVGSLVAPGASPAGGALHVQGVVMQMNEPQAAEPQQVSSPYTGSHADVHVVGMALTFMMVILMVGMWTPVSRMLVISNSEGGGWCCVFADLDCQDTPGFGARRSDSSAGGQLAGWPTWTVFPRVSSGGP